VESATGFKLKADEIGDAVTFDIAGTVKSFQASTFVGGSLFADSINNVKIKDGTLGADLVSRDGAINSVYAYKAIEGDIISETFIKKITSKTGGLIAGVEIRANNGAIGSINLAGDMAGKIIAAGRIVRLASRDGTLSGSVRAIDQIGTVSFNSIENATISSYNDIKAVLARGSIVDSYILAGYDVGTDGELGNVAGYGLNPTGATLKTIRTDGAGSFNGSFAMAGVQPYYNTDTVKWGAAPEGQEVKANFGEIGQASLGEVLEGNSSDPYGLFAASRIGKVNVTRVAGGANAADFQTRPSP
jgi:hypothetical protein